MWAWCDRGVMGECWQRLTSCFHFYFCIFFAQIEQTSIKSLSLWHINAFLKKFFFFYYCKGTITNRLTINGPPPLLLEEESFQSNSKCSRDLHERQRTRRTRKTGKIAGLKFEKEKYASSYIVIDHHTTLAYWEKKLLPTFLRNYTYSSLRFPLVAVNAFYFIYFLHVNIFSFSHKLLNLFHFTSAFVNTIS